MQRMTSRKLTKRVCACVEENNKRYQENPHYTERQEINEHIFGNYKKTMGLPSRTQKRQWGTYSPYVIAA
jgi:hypothetical protein